MKDEPKTIVWRPAIYVRGVGTIELTIEQVRKICAEHKRSCQQRTNNE